MLVLCMRLSFSAIEIGLFAHFCQISSGGVYDEATANDIIGYERVILRLVHRRSYAFLCIAEMYVDDHQQ